MDIKKKLAEIINRLFLNTGATFSGIFIQDKPVISKTIYTDKKDQLEETLKLIIYKAHQINEFLPEFGEEYVYAEGDDVSIFVYFVRPDIAIASIIEKKPKFALLKLEHTSVASKLKGMESQIDDYIKGISPTVATTVKSETQQTEEEERQPQGTGETEKQETTEKDRPTEKSEKVGETQDIEELEKILSETEEKTPPLEELLKPEPVESHPLDEVIKTADSENPPLEDLLKKESVHTGDDEEISNIEEEIQGLSEEMEYYDREVLTKIQQELLKEIGPVGKFLFKKHMKELNIDEDKITRNDLIRLIDELSNDIIDKKKKDKFVERVSAFL